jgi:hypothetical protein
MKKIHWKQGWKDKEAYPIIKLSKPITNLNGYYPVESIGQLRGVYYWQNPASKHLTHQLFFDTPDNTRVIKDISSQIRRGIIWKQVVIKKEKKPKVDKNQTSLF